MAKQSIINCPSGLQLMVRALEMKEANFFANSKLLQNGALLDEIIHACVVSVSEKGPYDSLPDKPQKKDWEMLLTGDRYYIGLEVRKLTYPDNVDFKENCKACGSLMSVDMDLDNVAIYDLPEESEDAFKSGACLETEVMGGKYTLKWHLQTGRDEKRAERWIKENELVDRDEMVTVSLAMRIDEISGIDPNDKVRFLNHLPAEDMMELIAQMEEMDCGIDLEATHRCEHCQSMNEVSVPFLSQAMWLPKRKLKRKKRVKRGSRQ